jgi:hypothetical protein
MKVLDPSSVVRESEFENAARTAWYSNPAQIYQQYVKMGMYLMECLLANLKKIVSKKQIIHI